MSAFILKTIKAVYFFLMRRDSFPQVFWGKIYIVLQNKHFVG